MATRRVRGPSLDSRSSRSSVTSSWRMSTWWTVTPRSAAIAFQVETFASWSRVVTTISSRGPSVDADAPPDLQGQGRHVLAELDLVRGPRARGSRRPRRAPPRPSRRIRRWSRTRPHGSRSSSCSSRRPRRSPAAGPACRRVRPGRRRAGRPARGRGRGTRREARRHRMRASVLRALDDRSRRVPERTPLRRREAAPPRPARRWAPARSRPPRPGSRGRGRAPAARCAP